MLAWIQHQCRGKQVYLFLTSLSWGQNGYRYIQCFWFSRSVDRLLPISHYSSSYKTFVPHTCDCDAFDLLFLADPDGGLTVWALCIVFTAIKVPSVKKKQNRLNIRKRMHKSWTVPFYLQNGGICRIGLRKRNGVTKWNLQEWGRLNTESMDAAQNLQKSDFAAFWRPEVQFAARK